MDDPSDLRCPCGAPAPDPLPPAGGDPVRCAACGTPLVRAGGVPADAVLRAVGSALLVAAACAAAWAVVARATATGAPWAIVVAGAAIGGTARLAAQARGPRVRGTAAAVFVVFLGLGEGALYRTSLLPRLEAMHAAEGAPDAASLAVRERETTDLVEYLQIEVGFAWLVATGAGLWLATRIPRLPPAVAVFSSSPAPPAPYEPP